jgi:ABC-type transport system involved in multi-copper enzyme maturation permease subunit
MLKKQRVIGCCLIVLFCGLLTNQSQAQLDTMKTLSPHWEAAPIDSLIRYVRRHAGFRFIISSEVIQGLGSITYYGQNVPLYKLLDTH